MSKILYPVFTAAITVAGFILLGNKIKEIAIETKEIVKEMKEAD